ncbi:MAG: hypothetical protein RI906_1333, partial [Pseudomonadota bacterium]
VSGNDGFKVLLGNGAGGFVNGFASASSYGRYDISVEQLDGDGLPDVLLQRSGDSNTVEIFTNNSLNPVARPIDLTPPTITVSADRSSLKPGETATISFMLSESSTDFVMSDVSVSGGALSGFTGSGTSYSATFTPTALSSAKALLSVANGRFSDAAGNLNADGNDADNTVTLSIEAASPPPSGGLEGVVYHWKTHALMSGVQVGVTPKSAVVSGTQLFELRGVKFNATGDVEAELWVNLSAPAGNLDVQIDFAGALGVAFAASTAMPAAWTVYGEISQIEGAQSVLVSGIGLSDLTGAVRLGDLTIDVPQGQSAQSVSFVYGEAGSEVLTPYGAGLGLTKATTDADGHYGIGIELPGVYRFEASRAVLAGTTSSTGDTGNVISSADALAALKLAVGINPNTGGAAVSPYQFLSADVTGDGKVSSADALGILKMAVKRSDAPAREWLFVQEGQDFWNEAANSGKGAFTTTRTAVGGGKLPTDIEWTGAQDVNLVGMLKGDVNGSWQAPTGSQVLPDSYFHNLVAANPLTMNLAQFGVTPIV